MESIDYIKLSESRMTDQFRFDQAFLALVYTIIEQRAKRQQEYFSFLDTFLDIDKSEGKALDLIGSIVGQERRLVNFIQEPYFGFQGARFAEALDVGYWYSQNKARIGRLKILNDEEYRKLIKARIINNRSRCTRDDLLSILNILTGNNESEVIEVSHGVFKVSIVDDINGLASYFLSKYRDKDTIFSIPLGYRMSVIYKTPNEPEIPIGCEGAVNFITFATLNGVWDILINDDLYDTTGRTVEQFLQQNFDGIFLVTTTDGVRIENIQVSTYRFKLIPKEETSFTAPNDNITFMEQEDGSLTFCLSPQVT